MRFTTLLVLFFLASVASACQRSRPGDERPLVSGDGGMPMADSGPPPTPSPDAGPATPTCSNECEAGEPARCSGAGYQTCSRGPDGCYVWSDITACASGTSCEDGVCRGTGCPGGCCPRCDGTSCGAGSDGCGGTCACAAGSACSSASTCCMPENGAASCNRILGAWCSRVVTCCTAAGSGVCVDWAYSVADCRGAHVAMGFDCSSTEWTSMSYCAEGIDRCVGDIPLVACTDITGGTAALPGSC